MRGVRKIICAGIFAFLARFLRAVGFQDGGESAIVSADAPMSGGIDAIQNEGF